MGDVDLVIDLLASLDDRVPIVQVAKIKRKLRDVVLYVSAVVNERENLDKPAFALHADELDIHREFDPRGVLAASTEFVESP
jgi:hypothetical protein